MYSTSDRLFTCVFIFITNTLLSTVFFFCLCAFLLVSGLERLPAPTGELAVSYGRGNLTDVADASNTVSLAIDFVERYGLTVLTLEALVDYLLTQFLHIYDIQNGFPSASFTTVDSLLSALPNYQFPTLANKTLAQYLQAEEFEPLLIDELAAITVAAIYNQDVNTVTALSGVTALARSPTSDYWSVRGGNELLCGRLLEHTNVSLHLSSTVTGITKSDSGYTIQYANKQGIASAETFDFVIVATPVHESNIALSGFSPRPLNPGRYQTTVTTLVHGSLNMSFFGQPPSSSAPWMVGIPASVTDLPFSLIERTRPADGSAETSVPVWKIQSTNPLSSDLVHDLFATVVNMTHHTFQAAYPHFTSPDPLGPLLLDDGVLYPSGIEWASSAMEMGAIAGRNTAVLINQALARRLERNKK